MHGSTANGDGFVVTSGLASFREKGRPGGIVQIPKEGKFSGGLKNPGIDEGDSAGTQLVAKPFRAMRNQQGIGIHADDPITGVKVVPRVVAFVETDIKYQVGVQLRGGAQR